MKKLAIIIIFFISSLIFAQETNYKHEINLLHGEKYIGTLVKVNNNSKFATIIDSSGKIIETNIKGTFVGKQWIEDYYLVNGWQLVEFENDAQAED